MWVWMYDPILSNSINRQRTTSHRKLFRVMFINPAEPFTDNCLLITVNGLLNQKMHENAPKVAPAHLEMSFRNLVAECDTRRATTTRTDNRIPANRISTEALKIYVPDD